ncbi:MAG: response regulator [Desulfarculaceae bacterium]|nr:response regulator [Desulfarculaceae bacterium]MCF8074300.1 response regulator [Desulfarculaceae bacterium]MCF8103368.1 response regulator [Desulfarculaceae bacterium]MCF8117777.1 response regulator [Desulfarculaceae bacterium]
MPDENPISVLLVDDEEAFREALARRLARKGLSVVTAPGGVPALERLSGPPVDVVVLDVKMPDLDGLSVLAQIKQAWPLTEVIMLSGHADLPTSITGLENGAFDYMLKPTPLDELLDKIRDAWEKKAVAEKKIAALRASAPGA